MSSDLEIVIFGSPDSVEATKLCLPITHKILFDFQKLRNYLANRIESYYFILLLLDFHGQNADSALQEIKQQNNLFAIFICCNQVLNIGNNPINIFRISKHLITYKITSSVIHFFERASQRLFALNRPGPADVLEQKGNDIKKWLTTNDRIKACHALIIPLNTCDANLIDFQQSLIELCNDLCPDIELIVCTLHDYIPSDESDSDILANSRFFAQKPTDIISHLLTRSAPIRIYLVGNETRITNYWSRLLIAKELDNGHDTVYKYIDRCTFMENQPINPDIKRNLADFLGCTWQVTNTMPIRLDDIRNDIHFPSALYNVNSTLEVREMKTNVDLCQQSLTYREHSPEYSSKFHPTGQAQYGPTEENDGIRGEINNVIHWQDLPSGPN